MQGVYIIRWDFDEVFMFHVFLNKRSEGGAVGVVLIQISKLFDQCSSRKRSPLEASSQLQKNVIVVELAARMVSCTL
jgi:hypothetical protein